MYMELAIPAIIIGSLIVAISTVNTFGSSFQKTSILSPPTEQSPIIDSTHISDSSQSPKINNTSNNKVSFKEDSINTIPLTSDQTTENNITPNNTLIKQGGSKRTTKKHKKQTYYLYHLIK